ncbi:UNKNOWN [Stylonychia lemnae]|uniref:Uncharacterized protein n=1 Tax=Stylonychia lemnae TaxID=5949 RepID=A0A078AWU6_STYLE|nr:UNKNOWN [Stylonychia lemnae]|eukprot:CDW86639.1 UNKNOWN [Stylonychia lemnae]
MSTITNQEESQLSANMSKTTTGRYSKNGERDNQPKMSSRITVRNGKKVSMNSTMMTEDENHLEEVNVGQSNLQSDSNIEAEQPHSSVSDVKASLSKLRFEEPNEDQRDQSDAQGQDQANQTMDGITNFSSKKSSKKRSLQEICNDQPGEEPLCENSSKRKRNFDDNKQDADENVFIPSRVASLVPSQNASKERQNVQPEIKIISDEDRAIQEQNDCKPAQIEMEEEHQPINEFEGEVKIDISSSTREEERQSCQDEEIPEEKVQYEQVQEPVLEQEMDVASAPIQQQDIIYSQIQGGSYC